jgi:anaerobic selenocysteine-containing dehydrogenase
MNVKRRDFFKGCAAATVLLLPGVASAAKGGNIDSAAAMAADARIEKSIKAGFGGGFSVRTHRQSAGLTYADIEHLGHRYTVASTDLLDWRIVASV